MKDICKKCGNRAASIRSRSGGHAIVWHCRKISELWFGYQFQYDAGQNMHSKCEQFKAEEWRLEVADGRNN